MKTKHIYLFEAWQNSLNEGAYVPKENEMEIVEKGIKVIEKMMYMNMKSANNDMSNPTGEEGFRTQLEYATPADKEFRESPDSPGKTVKGSMVDWKEAFDIAIKLFKEGKSCVENNRHSSNKDERDIVEFYWVDLLSWDETDDGRIHLRIYENGEVCIDYFTEFSYGADHKPTSDPKELLKQLVASAEMMRFDIKDSLNEAEASEEMENIADGVQLLERLLAEVKKMGNIRSIKIPKANVFATKLHYGGPCNTERNDLTQGALIKGAINWEKALENAIQMFKTGKSCVDNGEYTVNLVECSETRDGQMQISILDNGGVAIRVDAEDGGRDFEDTLDYRKLIGNFLSAIDVMQRELKIDNGVRLYRGR
jgi:hypothetical protein